MRGEGGLAALNDPSRPPGQRGSAHWEAGGAQGPSPPVQPQPRDGARNQQVKEVPSRISRSEGEGCRVSDPVATQGTRGCCPGSPRLGHPCVWD